MKIKLTSICLLLSAFLCHGLSFARPLFDDDYMQDQPSRPLRPRSEDRVRLESKYKDREAGKSRFDGTYVGYSTSTISMQPEYTLNTNLGTLSASSGGFSLGIGVTQSVVTKVKDPIKGRLNQIAIGFGRVSNDAYIGIEAELFLQNKGISMDGNSSSTQDLLSSVGVKIDNNNTNLKFLNDISYKPSYGLNIKFGYTLMDRILGYLLIGVESVSLYQRMFMVSQIDITSGVSLFDNNAQVGSKLVNKYLLKYGAGVELALFSNISIFAEMYTLNPINSEVSYNLSWVKYNNAVVGLDASSGITQKVAIDNMKNTRMGILYRF